MVWYRIVPYPDDPLFGFGVWPNQSTTGGSWSMRNFTVFIADPSNSDNESSGSNEPGGDETNKQSSTFSRSVAIFNHCQ